MGLGGEKPEGSRPDFTEGWRIKTNQLIPRQSVNPPRNKNICKSSIIAQIVSKGRGGIWGCPKKFATRNAYGVGDGFFLQIPLKSSFLINKPIL
jgi:hypothetical protein